MTRVRKARRSSRVACSHWVTAGQQIVSRDRGPWVCVDCSLPSWRHGTLGGTSCTPSRAVWASTP